MPSLTRIFSSLPQTRKSLGLRGYAGTWMIAAWAVFWLNTALFPCCEVAAAIFDGHTSSGSQTVPAAPSHHDDSAHSEPSENGHGSPCGESVNSAPVLIASYEGPAPERFSLDGFVPGGPLATGHKAVYHPANLARAGDDPPPWRRFYLRTQRLLI